MLFLSENIDQKCYNKHRFSGRFGEKIYCNSRQRFYVQWKNWLPRVNYPLAKD
jgi:hypothetical protein